MKLVLRLGILLSLSLAVNAKRTPEEVWADTGLNFSTFIYKTINQKNCTQSARILTACVSTLNYIVNHEMESKKKFIVKVNLDQPNVSFTIEDVSKLSTEEYFETYKKNLNNVYASGLKIESYLPLKKLDIDQRLLNLEEKIKNEKNYSLISAEIFNNFLSIAYDPHTYIAPKNSFDESSKGSQDNRGLGISFTSGTKDMVILEVYKDSPAEKVGLRRKDIIISINGKKEANDMFTELSDKDEFSILIKRSTKEFLFKVTKDEYSINQLETSILRRGKLSYGYIKLRSFMMDNACEDIQNEAESMLRNNLQGFILDLRDNGGGNVNVAICIKNLFLEKGSIVWVNKYDESDDLYYTRTLADGPKPFKDYHNVVLINGQSASASESTSLFLKDYRKAYIVGESSYGKGSMQGIDIQRDNPKILIASTMALFFGPKGISPQLTGVIPDFEVYPEIDQKIATKFYREKDSHILPIPLNQPLQTDYIQSDRKTEISIIKNCVSGLLSKGFDQLSDDDKAAYDHQLDYGMRVIECAQKNHIPVYKSIKIPFVKKYHFRLETNYI